MIKYMKGNLLSVTKGIIAHGCNCQGVMGSGVALAIKNKYPQAYKNYHAQCVYNKQDGNPTSNLLGCVVYASCGDVLIANCFTQDRYGTETRYINYEALYECLEEVFQQGTSEGLTVNLPKIGCGLAGGYWSIVERMVVVLSEKYGTDIVVWEL